MCEHVFSVGDSKSVFKHNFSWTVDLTGQQYHYHMASVVGIVNVWREKERYKEYEFQIQMKYFSFSM